MIRSRTLGENCTSAHGFPDPRWLRAHPHPMVDVWNRGHREVSVLSFAKVSHERHEVRRAIKVAVASAMDRQERFRQRSQRLSGIGQAATCGVAPTSSIGSRSLSSRPGQTGVPGHSHSLSPRRTRLGACLPVRARSTLVNFERERSKSRWSPHEVLEATARG